MNTLKALEKLALATDNGAGPLVALYEISEETGLSMIIGSTESSAIFRLGFTNGVVKATSLFNLVETRRVA